MSVRNIVRRATIQGVATPSNAPIYVDSDDNKLKMIPAGSGTTEVEVVDVSSAQSISGKTFSGNLASDMKVLAADFTASSADTGTTLTSLVGVSWAVVAAGVYAFKAIIPKVTMTTNNGLKLAFKLTTATLTSVNLRARSSTDTDNTGAVSASFVTTTDQSPWVSQNAVVYTNLQIEGTLVVLAAGTIAVQAAANASHADVLNILAGASFELKRTS